MTEAAIFGRRLPRVTRSTQRAQVTRLVRSAARLRYPMIDVLSSDDEPASVALLAQRMLSEEAQPQPAPSVAVSTRRARAALLVVLARCLASVLLASALGASDGSGGAAGGAAAWEE